jgi:N-acetylglutamate synthase
MRHQTPHGAASQQNSVEPQEWMRELEEASLAAWPALEEELFDGWRLRFSDGFTKRANSVQPFAGSTVDLLEKVAFCEDWYAAREQRCIFRLTPFSDPRLESELTEQGYEEIDRTMVMKRGIGAELAPKTEDQFAVADLDEWLGVFAGLSEWSTARAPAFRRILERGIESRSLAVLNAGDSSEPVACGMAAVNGRYVGLFDLVTGVEHRRAGFGTALVERILEWGAREGADQAYLQVVSTNVPARRLYTKLGFEPVYEYRYRVQPNR